jgi:ribosomal protein S24E
MAIKKLEEKNNTVLRRKEVKFVVESGKNPTFEDMAEVAAKEFKADKEAIVIKKIKGKFGRDTFLITAFAYDSKEDKEKTEKKKKVKKAPGAK